MTDRTDVLTGDIEAWLEVRSAEEIRSAIKAMLASEREACAIICDEVASKLRLPAAYGATSSAENIRLSIV